uniref:Uncharacterized protein n=1 Tax=Cacopsylla melanoneura TaxID=428564 RepID=A0A8D8V2V2_9HEMI
MLPQLPMLPHTLLLMLPHTLPPMLDLTLMLQLTSRSSQAASWLTPQKLFHQRKLHGNQMLLPDMVLLLKLFHQRKLHGNQIFLTMKLQLLWFLNQKDLRGNQTLLLLKLLLLNQRKKLLENQWKLEEKRRLQANKSPLNN